MHCRSRTGKRCCESIDLVEIWNNHVVSLGHESWLNLDSDGCFFVLSLLNYVVQTLGGWF